MQKTKREEVANSRALTSQTGGKGGEQWREVLKTKMLSKNLPWFLSSVPHFTSGRSWICETSEPMAGKVLMASAEMG